VSLSAQAETGGPLTRRLTRTVTWTMVLLVLGVLLTQVPYIIDEAHIPPLWIMTALGAIAGTQAFVATPATFRTPVIICPSICFTFAVLLCWGLGPAILAQTVAIAVVAWRLRRPFSEAAEALAQYTVSFAAAELILWWGNPDPLHHHAASQVASDAFTVLGAVAVWLLVYAGFAIALARLNGTGFAYLREGGNLANQVLFKTALVMLSPILAVAAHVNIGFVPLVFVPLYAVQRMAKLSSQRDRASRLDPLTGLANRTGLKLAFTALTGPTRDPDARVTLLLADLDEFKHVNDALGHEVGDQLLVAVAERLARIPVPDGSIARLGGDEFAVITKTRNPADALELARAVVSALDEPVSLDGLHVDVTASVGIAMHEAENEDFATLMRHADIAMYDAKQRGGGIAAYEPGSHQDSVERLALLTDFRRALEQRDGNQIAMHYQPQVCLKTGTVQGVEALLRWRHPTLGPISTQDLISLAERSSVMHLLTMRVIDEVVAQVASWAADGIEIRASINVSSRDLYGDDIVMYLANQLSRFDVDPSRIQIEITESALLRDPNRVAGTVTRICALGVSVALDDFGTGYSSLQHLRKLPISEIKIDKSFVAGMAHNHDDAAIVRSTVEMARSLGIRTVAEGVETEYTRALLEDAGCTLAQGWLTAHPMPAAELPDWMENFQVATA
jgi:diguanylate cyclase (GGDEF)-like protein